MGDAQPIAEHVGSDVILMRATAFRESANLVQMNTKNQLLSLVFCPIVELWSDFPFPFGRTLNPGSRIIDARVKYLNIYIRTEVPVDPHLRV